MALLVLGFASPVGPAPGHRDRRRRHLRQRGPARHLEDRADPVGRAVAGSSGRRSWSRSLRPAGPRRARGGDHRRQRAAGRTPAPDRAVRPAGRAGPRARAGGGDLGHGGPTTGRVHRLAPPPLGLVAQRGRRHRRAGRARDGHAAGRLARRHRGRAPFLLTTPFEAWHGLLAEPRFAGPILAGLVTSAVWSGASLLAAFLVLRHRDITGG